MTSFVGDAKLSSEQAIHFYQNISVWERFQRFPPALVETFLLESSSSRPYRIIDNILYIPVKLCRVTRRNIYHCNITSCWSEAENLCLKVCVSEADDMHE